MSLGIIGGAYFMDIKTEIFAIALEMVSIFYIKRLDKCDGGLSICCGGLALGRRHHAE